MSHRAYVRDLAALTVAAGIVIAVVGLAGSRVAAAVLLIVIPFAVTVVLLLRTLARALDAADEYCDRIDQELDAQRQLRVVRTVAAEPQPAPVIDLFTQEPVA